MSDELLTHNSSLRTEHYAEGILARRDVENRSPFAASPAVVRIREREPEQGSFGPVFLLNPGEARVGRAKDGAPFSNNPARFGAGKANLDQIRQPGTSADAS